MQGRTQSSASIWTAFNSMTTSVVRRVKFLLKIAWTRQENESAFGIVGSSVVNGVDLVKGLISEVTPTDSFQYFDESENVLSIEYDRQIQEPLSGLQMAIADITLGNMSSRYTPNINSTIGTSILPNRPIQSKIGFYVNGINQLVDVFKGLTLMPAHTKESRTVDISAYDYVKYINEKPLNSTLYENQRSDQIIEDILTSLGFGSGTYSLDQGLNTIGFAWFTKGQTAGERIKRICEAEDGRFFQDENGILRFENRNRYGLSPYNEPVWDIDPSHILFWREDTNPIIINTIEVVAKPREVSSEVLEVWRSQLEEQVEAGETKELWAQFENPVTSFEVMTEDVDYKAYTGSGSTGTDISSDLSITVTNFTTDVKLEITNNNASKAYVPLLKIRGTPALVTSEIIKTAKDTDSINKYGEQKFKLENDFIDDEDFAEFMANALVSKYSNPLKRAKLTVQGIPQLQLRDLVRVKDVDTNVYKNYRVLRIQGKLDSGSFIQDLIVREVTEDETRGFAIVDTSKVDGSDTVAP